MQDAYYHGHSTNFASTSEHALIFPQTDPAMTVSTFQSPPVAQLYRGRYLQRDAGEDDSSDECNIDQPPTWGSLQPARWSAEPEPQVQLEQFEQLNFGQEQDIDFDVALSPIPEPELEPDPDPEECEVGVIVGVKVEADEGPTTATLSLSLSLATHTCQAVSRCKTASWRCIPIFGDGNVVIR